VGSGRKPKYGLLIGNSPKKLAAVEAVGKTV